MMDDDFFDKQYKKLEKDLEKNKQSSLRKRDRFADQIMNGMGEELVKEITTPKPKLSFIQKLLKIISG